MKDRKICCRIVVNPFIQKNESKDMKTISADRMQFSVETEGMFFFHLKKSCFSKKTMSMPTTTSYIFLEVLGKDMGDGSTCK